MGEHSAGQGTKRLPKGLMCWEGRKWKRGHFRRAGAGCQNRHWRTGGIGLLEVRICGVWVVL